MKFEEFVKKNKKLSSELIDMFNVCKDEDIDRDEAFKVVLDYKNWKWKTMSQNDKNIFINAINEVYGEL